MILASGSVKFVCALSSGVGSMGAGSLPRCRRPSASRLARSSSRRRCSSSALPAPAVSRRAFASRILAKRSSRRFNSAGSSSPRRLPSAASCSASTCSACSSNLLNLPSQLPDFLVHVAVAHRLVPRGVGSHLGPVGGQVSQRDQAQVRRPVAALPGTGALKCDARRILRKSLIVRKSGGSLPTMARKADVAFARRRDLAAGADPDGVGVDQERDHHGHVERRLAAQFTGVLRWNGCEIHLRDEIDQQEQPGSSSGVPRLCGETGPWQFCSASHCRLEFLLRSSMTWLPELSINTMEWIGPQQFAQIRPACTDQPTPPARGRVLLGHAPRKHRVSTATGC